MIEYEFEIDGQKYFGNPVLEVGRLQKALAESQAREAKLRQAIEQAEKQDPVGVFYDSGTSFFKTLKHGTKLYTAPPKQEYLPWVDLQKAAEEIVKEKYLYKRFIEGTPLQNDISCWMADFANAPPKPEWIGLTDDDIESIIYGMIDCKESGVTGIARLVEKVLKEKNHG